MGSLQFTINPSVLMEGQKNCNLLIIKYILSHKVVLHQDDRNGFILNEY